jgi:transposase
MATVLAGPERRRRWSAGQKAQIVAESLAADASVVEVARRHDVHPNQLHAWRRQARLGVRVISPAERPRLVPVAIARGAGPATGVSIDALIEVALRNGGVLRLPASMSPARVADLADALEGLA